MVEALVLSDWQEIILLTSAGKQAQLTDLLGSDWVHHNMCDLESHDEQQVELRVKQQTDK